MWRLFTAVLALALLADCGAQSTGGQPGKFKIQGQVRAYKAYGSGGDFVEEGDDVVVRDGSTNEMLALGHLDSGTEEVGMQTWDYPFSVDGVPDGREFYAISIDNSPPKRFKREELDGVLQIEDSR